MLKLLTKPKTQIQILFKQVYFPINSIQHCTTNVQQVASHVIPIAYLFCLQY